jgi:hypothetical protein
MTADDTSGPEEAIQTAVERILAASIIAPALAVVVEVLAKIAGELSPQE